MYYQKDIECASREQIRAWQDERLVKTVKHVWDNCKCKPYLLNFLRYRCLLGKFHLTYYPVKMYNKHRVGKIILFLYMKGIQMYYQKDIECASREQIRAWQDERLVKTVKHVWDNCEYYRNKMKEKGVEYGDIKSQDDLWKLPFITKDDLREAYPYGLMSAPLSECKRIHSTSGTTGKRVIAFYTQNDLDLWDDCCARAIMAAGGTKEDVVQVCYGYGLFTGGFGLNGGSQKVGCLTLPMSSGNTERQLQFMTDLGSTILCCTPSYAAYLAESIGEAGLRDKIKLKAGIFGAEAWTEEMRHDIEDKLGIKAEQRRTLFRCATATVCSQAASDSTAVLRRLVV